ncbi:MAG: hypothetical protein AAGF77_11345 [Bacteroidota bacterium]
MSRLVFPCIPLWLLLTLGGCDNKDDDPYNPVDALPAITQSGAQTLGCLIDGEPFIPSNIGTRRPSAFYQFVDGTFTLSISGATGGGSSKSIIISGLDINGTSEDTFPLQDRGSGRYSARYIIGGGIEEQAETSSTNPGALTITRFDQEAFIVSGVFEFTAVGRDGTIYTITEGRFDLNYTN